MLDTKYTKMLVERTSVDLEASSPKNRLGNPATNPPVSKTEYLNLGNKFNLQSSVLNLQMQVQTMLIQINRFNTATASDITALLYLGETFALQPSE